METSAPPDPAALPAGANGNYNPVTVHDTVGVVFLGLITLTLLIAFIRAEADHRAALVQVARAR